MYCAHILGLKTVENDSELFAGKPRPVTVKCHTFIDAMSELPSGGSL